MKHIPIVTILLAVSSAPVGVGGATIAYNKVAAYLNSTPNCVKSL